MNFSTVKARAKALFDEAAFISEIRNNDDYEQALLLMDDLVDDYDNNHALIDLLSNSIERWENKAPEFSAFNQRVDDLDDGVAVLRVLMDQYQLKAEDLKNEIGSKSLVSMILSGSRNLTRDHIQALCARFGLNPAIFFSASSLSLVSS